MANLSRRHLLTGGAAALLGGCMGHRYKLPRDVVIRPGADTFTLAGGPGHSQHVITVHYYLPRAYTSRSPILIVLPGAGRNGFDYRDAWIPFAAEAGVFIAAPSYARADYDSAAYQMGGTLENLTMGTPLEGSSENVVYLRDEDIRFDLNPRRSEWLFNDFDRLFHIIKKGTDSSQTGYDMFGHSAGAQIAHRHVLLYPGSHARRVVAANAGFYTLPDLKTPPPVGLAGLGIDRRSLKLSFSRKLLVLLGEEDNHPERGGSHLHTPNIDRQGDNRLARGRYFHEFAAARAKALRTAYRWDLRVAPRIGHDFRAMTRVAAGILYG